MKKAGDKDDHLQQAAPKYLTAKPGFQYTEENDYQEQATVNKADSLVLSSKAQELNFVKEQVLKSPEVRAERITELKNRFRMATIKFLADISR